MITKHKTWPYCRLLRLNQLNLSNSKATKFGNHKNILNLVILLIIKAQIAVNTNEYLTQIRNIITFAFLSSSFTTNTVWCILCWLFNGSLSTISNPSNWVGKHRKNIICEKENYKLSSMSMNKWILTQIRNFFTFLFLSSLLLQIPDADCLMDSLDDKKPKITFTKRTTNIFDIIGSPSFPFLT